MMYEDEEVWAAIPDAPGYEFSTWERARSWKESNRWGSSNGRILALTKEGCISYRDREGEQHRRSVRLLIEENFQVFRCRRCSKLFDIKLIKFGKRKCPKCISIDHKEYRQNNPDIDLRRRRHGITVKEYEAMLWEQMGVCRICENPESKTRNGKIIRLSVDHDHRCCPGRYSCGKCVRALLCHSCNVGSGSFDHSPARLRRAATFFEGYPDKWWD